MTNAETMDGFDDFVWTGNSTPVVQEEADATRVYDLEERTAQMMKDQPPIHHLVFMRSSSLVIRHSPF